MIEFTRGNSYSFNTYTTAALQNIFTNVTLLGSMSFELASGIGVGGQNLAALAAAMIPSIPSTISKDPSTYTYLIFQNQNNTKVILAQEWINPNSVTLSAAQTTIVTVPNTGSSDQSKINSLLTLGGYSNLTFSNISATPPTIIEVIITAPPGGNANPLNTLSVSNGITNIACTAIGLYSNGTVANLSSQVIWTSSTPSIAAIGINTGIISPIKVGTSNINASISGLISNTVVVTIV